MSRQTRDRDLLDLATRARERHAEVGRQVARGRAARATLAV
jgi:hypothetical protein